MAQRQFRSDDTSTWNDRFGIGTDGSYTPSTGTDAPIDSTATGTSGATSLTATNVSFAPGQLILIHQTRGTGAGNWELNKIASYSTGTITTSYTLTNTYASGAQVLVLKQYTTVSIGGGVTYTAKAWDGSVGGIMGFVANTSFGGTGTLALAGKGFRGGVAPTGTNGGNQGEGTSGAGSISTSANGNGAGGGSTSGIAAGGGGGANSASGSSGASGEGTGGTGGSSAGAADLVTMVFGGAAGAGGSSADNNGTRSAGGNGGAILFVIAKNIDVSGITTTIDGGASGNATNRNGVGGSGAGGSALLKGHTIVLGSNKITAAAGSLGSGGTGAAGGAGSTGRIHADYLTSISGTTSPTIDSRQDLSLADITANALFFAQI